MVNEKRRDREILYDHIYDIMLEIAKRENLMPAEGESHRHFRAIAGVLSNQSLLKEAFQKGLERQEERDGR